MKIDAVDFFYVRMPEVLDIADGSQDALLVRIRSGSTEGWGECEAAPLVSLASWVAPMSHSACRPIIDSVLGQRLEEVRDIARIHALVRRKSLDLLQTDHTLSGIDIALWDLLGKRLQTPVYELLGVRRAFAKRPYASVLFGSDAQATLETARGIRAAGYSAAKFGWGPFGHGDVAADADQVNAAREGLGRDADLMVDAGTVWGEEDVDGAAARLPLLEAAAVTWLEEPFVTDALSSYRRLADMTPRVPLAGAEGCHTPGMARAMIDHGGIAFVQIDAGRIGGITSATEVARITDGAGKTFVNHTFTTQLALSASLQPFAGLERHSLCEYPVATTQLAVDLSTNRLERRGDGLIEVPPRPGLGIDLDPQAIQRYLVDVEIQVGGRVLYRSSAIDV